MAGLCAPLSTLRQYHRRYLRMTRGRCGSLLLHRDGLAPSTPCRSPGALRSTQSTDIDCVRYMPIARAAPRVRSSVTPRVNGPRSLITTVTDLPFRGFVTVTRDPKGSVRCATRQVRRPMSELGHTCPVIGWTGSSPRRGMVCKDYTAAPGEASAGSARLPPPGAGVY